MNGFAVVQRTKVIRAADGRVPPGDEGEQMTALARAPNRALQRGNRVAAITTTGRVTTWRRVRRVVLIGSAATAIAALALYWLTHRAPAPHYVTGVVSRGDVLRTATASGTVNPMTTIQVGTYVSGVLQELHCDFNTRVKAGQLCAKIDPRPYQTVVDQEDAALGTARAQLNKDNAALKFSKVIYDRDVDLLKRRIVSQETVDTASNSLDQAVAQVALDESTIAQRVATLSAAKVNLDYTNIVSPVDGTVVSRNVTQGQTVAASFQTPTLFLIATDLTQMQVDTNVSEADIGSVALGNPVEFTVEAYPDQSFTGTVTQVRQAPQSVQNVITYDAVVGVPNPQLLLKPGMTAAVRIVTARHTGVLRVPNQALRFTPPGTRNEAARGAVQESSDASAQKPRTQYAVWKLVDGRPKRVPVEVGLDDDTFTEIANGALSANDVIIVGVGGQTGTSSGGVAGITPPRIPRL
jgi:HlyD family secretion protein